MRQVQFASLVVFALMAVWYVAPLLGRLARGSALMVLLWVHVFRYVAVFTASAQHDGFPISADAVREVIVGDVVGAVMAMAAIFALRQRAQLGIWLTWLLSVETVVDFGVGIHRKLIEPLTAQPSGVLWLILCFFVPLVIVSVPLLVWQLWSRRRESLAATYGPASATRAFIS
jgi:hypothetical protein